MNILFYQPYNQTVVYIESVAEELAKRGHKLFFLSHAERGDTHENMEKFGCLAFASPIEKSNPLKYYFKRVKVLISFCEKNGIELVYSHFQEANLISVIAQYFCSAKFILTRHHSDCAFLDNNFNERMGDRIINKLAKHYIATSKKVYDQIVTVEKTRPSKVKLINYGYNFLHFAKPDPIVVSEIKNNYPATLLIVKAARFIPEKRHMILFKVINRLVNEGYDIKALILSKGPEQKKLESYIEENQLEGNIFMIGFKRNVQDYFAAADLVVHLSLSEASNSAMKEAGLVDSTAIICKDVGDFDDYFVDGINGFVLDKLNPEDQLYSLLKRAYNDKPMLKVMGTKLKESVVKRFDISNVIGEYKQLHHRLGLEF